MRALLTNGSIGRRVLVLAVMLIVQFAVIEAGLRLYGGFEASGTFQSLFMDDPQVGIRLRPNSHVRYSTVEFTADIDINAQGVRDDQPVGAKAPNERRIVVLGDSLVLSVQVSQAETFCKKLEGQLNARGGPIHWRVINGGVQGYGPVDEWLFFDKVAAAFQPDLVLIVAFVGNDAVEAASAAASLEAGRPVAAAQPGVRWFRRLIRSSMTLQSVRVRWDQLRSRIATGTPEAPLASYLTTPPPMVTEGLDVSRRAFQKIAERAQGLGARTGIVLMPARFQVNDTDFGHLQAAVREAGAELDRNAASHRFNEALTPLGLPILDLQPVLFAQPNRIGLFYIRTVHLTPRGHEVVADALLDFLPAAGLVSR